MARDPPSLRPPNEDAYFEAPNHYKSLIAPGIANAAVKGVPNGAIHSHRSRLLEHSPLLLGVASALGESCHVCRAPASHSYFIFSHRRRQEEVNSRAMLCPHCADRLELLLRDVLPEQLLSSRPVHPSLVDAEVRTLPVLGMMEPLPGSVARA